MNTEKTYEAGGYWLNGKWHPTNTIAPQSEPSYYENVFYSFEGDEAEANSTTSNSMLSWRNILLGAVLIGAGYWIYKKYIKN